MDLESIRVCWKNRNRLDIEAMTVLILMWKALMATVMIYLIKVRIRVREMLLREKKETNNRRSPKSLNPRYPNTMNEQQVLVTDFYSIFLTS